MWPACKTSKQPLARTMREPFAFSSVIRVISASRSRISEVVLICSGGRLVIGPGQFGMQDGVLKLFARHRCRATLHHDKPSSVIRQARRVWERRVRG